jgi:hypothetical protein
VAAPSIATFRETWRFMRRVRLTLVEGRERAAALLVRRGDPSAFL